MTRRMYLLTGIGLAVFALSTCGDGGTTPNGQTGAGWLPLTLTTNATDAGGIVLTIRGGTVDSVRSSYPHAFDKAVGPLHKVGVIGDLTAGTVAEIFVADRALASDYSATVDQAAARTLEQRDPADYSVAVGGQ